MYDAEAYGRQSTLNPSLPYTPPGSYYYVKDDTWNHLDRIAVTQNLIDGRGAEFAQESLRLVFPEFMSFNLRRYNNTNNNDEQLLSPLNFLPKFAPSGDYRVIRVPNRYNFDTLDESKRGFSDHLPVVFKLRQM